MSLSSASGHLFLSGIINFELVGSFDFAAKRHTDLESPKSELFGLVFVL